MENGNGHWTLDSQLATARLKNDWLLLLTHSVPPKAELPSAEVLLRSLEFQSRKRGPVHHPQPPEVSPAALLSSPVIRSSESEAAGDWTGPVSCCGLPPFPSLSPLLRTLFPKPGWVDRC